MIIKTSNPFDYNSVVAKQTENKVKLTPTAQGLLENPTANFLGKWLGLNNKTEWNQNYDKVQVIYDWAKKKANGSNDPQYLSLILKEKLNTSPEMAERRIDDLYINIRLEERREEN